MTIEESEEEYGTVQGYIDRLRELLELGDMRPIDMEHTLRDINFIRGEAGLEPLDEVEIADRLV